MHIDWLCISMCFFVHWITQSVIGCSFTFDTGLPSAANWTFFTTSPYSGNAKLASFECTNSLLICTSNEPEMKIKNRFDEETDKKEIRFHVIYVPRLPVWQTTLAFGHICWIILLKSSHCCFELQISLEIKILNLFKNNFFSIISLKLPIFNVNINGIHGK